MSDLFRCLLQCPNLYLEILVNLGVLFVEFCIHIPLFALLYSYFLVFVQQDRECLAFSIDISDTLDAL